MDAGWASFVRWITMPQYAEDLADLQRLDSLDARRDQGGATPDRNLGDGLPGHERDGPVRGIVLGVALSGAAWVLIGLAVLAWRF